MRFNNWTFVEGNSSILNRFWADLIHHGCDVCRKEDFHRPCSAVFNVHLYILAVDFGNTVQTQRDLGGCPSNFFIPVYRGFFGGQPFDRINKSDSVETLLISTAPAFAACCFKHESLGFVFGVSSDAGSAASGAGSPLVGLIEDIGVSAIDTCAVFRHVKKINVYSEKAPPPWQWERGSQSCSQSGWITCCSSPSWWQASSRRQRAREPVPPPSRQRARLLRPCLRSRLRRLPAHPWRSRRTPAGTPAS